MEATEKKVSHVPAPWTIDETENYRIKIIAPWSDKVTTENFSTFADYRGSHICEMSWNSGVPTHETAIANARLIAAAPDLLEALIACKTTLKAFLPDAFETISFAESAIKKAIG